MSKRLVMCCDGTWNTPDQRATTNVAKVALTAAPTDESGREQRLFYQRGVGTNPDERIRGGAFGFGLSRDVRNAYRFLVQNFDPGDELFFFGFSRGAYTARSTVGFVRNCGILRRDQAHRVDEAYSLYRSRAKRSRPRSMESELFRRSYSHEARIRFLGVWDTVGALGIPFSGSRLVDLVNRRWQFHDTTLSSKVDIACHALAIDEKRGPFEPTIWRASDAAGGQRREQVWFTGDHSDVGGGHSDAALADIALLWMVEQARSAGLAFDADAFARTGISDERARNTGKVVAPNAFGKLHESHKSFLFRFLPRFERRLGVTDGEHEHVASSAVQRHRDARRYVSPGLAAYLDRPDHKITKVDSGDEARTPASEQPRAPEPTG